jgi:hypothetical protein
MAAVLLQRRRRRQHLPGLLGRANLRPVDHVARLRRVTPSERGADPLTLEDLIVDVWEVVSVSKTVDCPVCGGEMEPRSVAATTSMDTSGNDVPCGECGDCGALLS